MIRNMEFAIFDFDGTVLDSMHIWENLGPEYLKSLGITPSETLKKTLKTLSLEQAADYFRAEYKLEKKADEITEGINSRIKKFYSSDLVLKEGAIELLHSYKAKGIKMAIATATDRHLVEASLKKNNLENIFDIILTCKEVGAGKDTPIIFEEALKKLGGSKENTWVFEDAHHAIVSAKKAGFTVIAIEDYSARKEKEKIKAMVDLYLETYVGWDGKI